MVESLESLLSLHEPEAYNVLSGEEEHRIATARRLFYDALEEDIPKYVVLWDGLSTSSIPSVRGEKIEWEHPSGRHESVAMVYRDVVPLQVNNAPKDFHKELVESEELGAPFFISFLRGLFHPSYHPLAKNSDTAMKRMYHLFMAYATHELSELPNPRVEQGNSDAYVDWKMKFMHNSALGAERSAAIRDYLRLPPKESPTPSWVSNAAFYEQLSHRKRDPALAPLFDPQLLDVYHFAAVARYSNGRRLDCVSEIPEAV